MAKIRKALVGAAGAALAVVADRLVRGELVDKAALATALGAAVAAFVAVWSVPNRPE